MVCTDLEMGYGYSVSMFLECCFELPYNFLWYRGGMEKSGNCVYSVVLNNAPTFAKRF
jgi:hypothetical protein